MKKYYEESLINIKICGITSVEIVDFLINNFVNYFGLIFYESSPRFVNLKEADLLVKAANIPKGAGEPNKIIVGSITTAQLEEIASIKLPDLNTTKISSAIKIVEGTARNMGISIAD